MTPTAEKPVLPAKVYLRRKDVERAVGGEKQLLHLIAAKKLNGVVLPGYTRLHFMRADVQRILDEQWGE